LNDRTHAVEDNFSATHDCARLIRSFSNQQEWTHTVTVLVRADVLIFGGQLRCYDGVGPPILSPATNRFERTRSTPMLKLPGHTRYAYSPIVERKDYNWPGGKRLAFYIALNIEHFAFGGLGMDPVRSGKQTTRNFAWRDYGNRIGNWRLFEILDELKLPATILLNSSVCYHYPQIVKRSKPAATTCSATAASTPNCCDRCGSRTRRAPYRNAPKSSKNT
jgi:hypothetical protein